MKRVVVDTNIFVSATLGGALEAILDRWRAGNFLLIVTDDIVQEYLDVLRRSKFDLASSIIDSIMAYVFQKAECVVTGERLQVRTADPDDNKFLEAAIAGEVDWIVSGDKHLLDIQAYRGIPIITARNFLDTFGK
jgi:uncharacterized protein